MKASQYNCFSSPLVLLNDSQTQSVLYIFLLCNEAPILSQPPGVVDIQIWSSLRTLAKKFYYHKRTRTLFCVSLWSNFYWQTSACKYYIWENSLWSLVGENFLIYIEMAWFLLQRREWDKLRCYLEDNPSGLGLASSQPSLQIKTSTLDREN